MPGTAVAGETGHTARLYGQPLEQIPLDLYIPPDALEIFLESFEGPLDLLLYLIRRQNFNVLDIPMAQLTRQYLRYVDEIRLRNLALAAEYLVMAATLIDIKSRLLLPRPPAESTEDAADPRAELVRRLIEYERIQQAASQLDALPRAGRDFWVARLPQTVPMDAAPLLSVNVQDLVRAWRTLATRARRRQPYTVEPVRCSVQDAIAAVLQALRDAPVLPFTRLFDPASGLSLLVVTLLAVLELVRAQRIAIAQDAPWAPIAVARGRAFAD